MTCPDCERYKKSAANWRNKAYELGGTPLPWDREDLWVGLTEDEVSEIIHDVIGFNSCWGPEEAFAQAIEAKLKEKNG